MRRLQSVKDRNIKIFVPPGREGNQLAYGLLIINHTGRRHGRNVGGDGVTRFWDLSCPVGCGKRTMLGWECVRITPEEIKPGDVIAFDYSRPNEHVPSRVGEVYTLLNGNRTVRIWDFSLHTGPDWRSYRLEGMRNLSRVENMTTRPSQSSLSSYQDALVNFGRILLGKIRTFRTGRTHPHGPHT